jgi:hypothetical protein
MHMKNTIEVAQIFALALTLMGGTLGVAQQAAAGPGGTPARPQGPCDIYAAAGDACVAAHSTTRALYAAYNGPLYQVLRQSDGKTLDIGIVQPVAARMRAAMPTPLRRTGSAPTRTAGSRRSTTNLPSTTI